MLVRPLAARIMLPLLAAAASACGASAGAGDSSGGADLSADRPHQDAGAPKADSGASDGGAATADGDAPGADGGPAPSDDDCDEATFVFASTEASAVYVTGDFTTPPWADATSGALPMTQSDGSVFTLTTKLGARGHHLYKFIAIEQSQALWLTDPLNPLREPDGLGDGVNADNSVVGHWRAFVFPSPAGFAPVSVTGSFTSPPWDPAGEPLLWVTEPSTSVSLYIQTLELPSGTSEYLFIPGDSTTWDTDPYNTELAPSGLGGFNSVAHVCHE